MKKTIANEYLDYCNEKVNSLVMQGDFIKILNEEDEDITWKSIIYSVPRGVLSFACRSKTNSLAINDNLLRWGKKTTSWCHLTPPRNILKTWRGSSRSSTPMASS